MIPSYSRKAISGQNNYLGMVTSYKMSESEMDYRGSKSSFDKKFVKEQRVDGSWSIKAITKKMLLRCTLMGFERNYQVKILSKQLNQSFYSTISKSRLFPIQEDVFRTSENDIKWNPYFISGFADAEASFGTTIYKNKNLKTGYRVRSYFSIHLNQQDSFILLQIQKFFGGIGSIRSDKKANALVYSVEGLRDLSNIIIPHFKKYPLISQKAADFILFEQIVELMNRGAHTNMEGLQQIINIKASINLGISETIHSEILVEPVNRPIINTINILDPNWVSGFVSGEGNFDAGIRTSNNLKKENVTNLSASTDLYPKWEEEAKRGKIYLRFRLTQHERDTQLMDLIIKYLGAGRLEKDSRKPLVYLVVGNFIDLTKKIIPFFNKYPILGKKYLDFQDWCKIADLMTSRSHLTDEGFKVIKQIESGMNKSRKK
jgi:LAGLIDADG endonuclease